jgi:hypothetical protein
MAGLADGGLYLGGGDHCCVLSWSVYGFSWSDTEPARYRRLHPGLQSGCVHYVICSVRGSNLIFVQRLRRAVGVERQQLKWLAYAAGGLAVGILLISIAILTVVIPGIPISIGIAILRYRLYDIDIIIKCTLVYGSLTSLLVLVYFGGVTTTQALFRILTGQQEQPQLAVVAYGYRLDLVRVPGKVVLCRQDGTEVARFRIREATARAIEQAAQENRRRIRQGKRSQVAPGQPQHRKGLPCKAALSVAKPA